MNWKVRLINVGIKDILASQPGLSVHGTCYKLAAYVAEMAYCLEGLGYVFMCAKLP
jgi:hypothetical protein